MIISKPNRDSLARSFRSITLLNTLGKVLDKIIERRLAASVEDKLPPQQYGGRKGDAVAKLVEGIARNQKNQKISSIMAIAIKETFDNVHRDTLLETINHMNLPGAIYNRVYHFMNERRTCMIVDGKRTKQELLLPAYHKGRQFSFALIVSNLHDAVLFSN